MKKWIAMFLMMVLFVSMVGCTGHEDTQADSTTKPTEPSTTVTTAPTEATEATEPTETTKPVPTLPGAMPTAPTEPTETTEPPTTAATEPTTTVAKITEQLSLGSQMPDVTITDVQGNSYNLYELLAEKQMVMLNFWFIECPYCVEEFPCINSAYNQYKDSVEVLALNPYNSAITIKIFQAKHKLDFPMCNDPYGLSDAFSVRGYPTTVIIDRYGVVCLVSPGGIPDESVFLKIFEVFTADDYETVLYKSVTEITG